MKKIDMHCHILPGIDDGSANPKETLAMLRMALNQDFVGMIVTPHGSVRNASVERVQEIRTLCKKFRIQAYQRLGVRLPVFPGQEIIGDEAWQAQALQNCREMVCQCRNHPSVFLWGVRVNGSSDNEAFYKRTNEAVHRLDPTRPTGVKN